MSEWIPGLAATRRANEIKSPSGDDFDLSLVQASRYRAPMQTTPAIPDLDTKSTSYIKVADYLRAEIIDGHLAHGERLKVQELSSRLGVSAQPVREALQLLQGEGLVNMEPNRGATVRGLDLTRLRHIYELREAIEAAMTRRFAEEAALSDIRNLEAIHAEHEDAMKSGDHDRVDRANLEFHAYIVAHSGNDEAIALRARYFKLTYSLRRRFGFAPKRWETALHDHRQLIDAFRRRDGVGAYTVAALHVRRTFDELAALIQEREAQAVQPPG